MSEIRKDILAESELSWDGAEMPSYPQGQPKVSVLRILIPAGTRLAPHYHKIINAGVVLRGNLTVVACDGVERTFHAGDAIIEMVGKVHYGENRGPGEVELIMFYAGVTDTELSTPATYK